jgi:hypothetical protein
MSIERIWTRFRGGSLFMPHDMSRTAARRARKLRNEVRKP